jgi:hypothetical protein
MPNPEEMGVMAERASMADSMGVEVAAVVVEAVAESCWLAIK